MRETKRTYNMDELSRHSILELARGVNGEGFKMDPKESGLISDEYDHEIGRQEGLRVEVDCRTEEGKRLAKYLETFELEPLNRSCLRAFL